MRNKRHPRMRRMERWLDGAFMKVERLRRTIFKSDSSRKLLEAAGIKDSQQLNEGSKFEIRVDDVKQCTVNSFQRASLGGK